MAKARIESEAHRLALGESMTEFESIQFPARTRDERLDDLFIEVVDYDSAIAGLIELLLRGDEIEVEHLRRLRAGAREVRAQLHQFRGSDDSAEAEIIDCVNYLTRLDLLVGDALAALE